MKLSLPGGELLHYRVDDFCDPWTRPTAILAIHGLAESGRVWFAWVPALARTHPLIRPDLPGFGLSTPVAENGHWSVDGVADALASLIDHLGHAAVHVIGQRAGGAIALNLALRHPARIRSLVLISAPLALPQSRGSASGASWRDQLRQDGVAGLNRRTMKGRLGNAPQAQQDWWTGEMNRTALPSMMAAAEAMESLDLAARLEQVAGAHVAHHQRQGHVGPAVRRAGGAPEDGALAADGAARRLLPPRSDRAGRLQRGCVEIHRSGRWPLRPLQPAMTARIDLRHIADDTGEATVMLPGGLAMHYRVDDFTDPWTEPRTVVLLHGVAESSIAWYGWVPHFARRYRVVRPDMRGFGQTTAMPADHAWSLDELADDLLAFFDALDLDRPHLVAAKVGGMVALHFAARHPGRLASLTVVGTPVRGSDVTSLAGYGADVVKEHGVAHWAANGQAARLGPDMPPEAHAWWTAMMGRTPAGTQEGFLRHLHRFDATAALERIACPVLVITNGATTGKTRHITSAESIRVWQRRIADSRLLVMPSQSYHTAASEPDAAARAVRQFIDV